MIKLIVRAIGDILYFAMWGILPEAITALMWVVTFGLPPGLLP
jgi:hypothetical protein